mmetsp:Transcript_31363/g.66400  ORF Transcript_31363/g.66400 Transcript_31363/m.66400 type:complete len:278 (-) Transcript_31363:3509-4342(-)
MATPIASMSIMDLKRELMNYNDSSFVFNDRDELECALRSCRQLDQRKKKVGLAQSITVPSSHAGSDDATAATTPSSVGSSTSGSPSYYRKMSSSSVGSSTVASSTTASSTISHGMGPVARRASFSKEARSAPSREADYSDDEDEDENDFFPPDLTSLSSSGGTNSHAGSASRGSSQSSSSPSPARPHARSASASASSGGGRSSSGHQGGGKSTTTSSSSSTTIASATRCLANKQSGYLQKQCCIQHGHGSSAWQRYLSKKYPTKATAEERSPSNYSS